MDNSVFEPGLGLAPILDGDVYKPLATIASVAGLQAALDALQGGINGKANASHTHTIDQVTGLWEVIGGKLNKAGDTITGTLAFGKGRLQTDGDIYAVRNDGNTGVIFLNGAGSRYLYYNGSNYDLSAASLTVGGNVTATGVFYAGNGSALFNSDGNVNGAKWGLWHSSGWAFEAIETRIESRAEAWARAVAAGYIAKDRVTSAGFVGGDVNQPYMMYDGWSIEVLVSDRNLMGKIAAKTHVDALGVYALAQYYTGGGDNLGPNQPINGSQLKYASARWGSGSTLPGTWNLHGHIKYSADAAEQSRVSLFVRKY